MTTATPPPPTSTPGASGAPARPTRRTRLGSALAVLGVALLFAGVVLSAVFARAENPTVALAQGLQGGGSGSGDLDWVNYGPGLGATLVLLVLAAVGTFRGGGRRGHLDHLDHRDHRDHRAALAVWPAAFGALGAGAMVAVALEDGEATAWVVGGVVLGISVVFYLLTRGGALAVTAVVGLAILYVKVADLVLGGLDTEGFIVPVLTVAVFTVVVTAVGWFLPRARFVVGVFTGAVTVVVFVLILLVSAFLSAIGSAFGSFGAPPGSPAPDLPSSSQFDDDVYVTLAVTAALVLVWALATALTDHPGYKTLVVAAPALVVPSAVVALAVESTEWWTIGFAVVGAVVLVVAVLAAGPGGRGPRGAAPAPPPNGSDTGRPAGQGYPPPADPAGDTTTTAPGRPPQPGPPPPTR